LYFLVPHEKKKGKKDPERRKVGPATFQNREKKKGKKGREREKKAAMVFSAKKET